MGYMQMKLGLSEFFKFYIAEKTIENMHIIRIIYLNNRDRREWCECISIIFFLLYYYFFQQLKNNYNKIFMENTIGAICKQCRICKNNKLVDIIDLGEQIITSRFPVYGNSNTPSTPVVLCLCEECSLVQLRYATNACELYEYDYGYRSGVSNTMRNHLKLYQQEILSKINLDDGDAILDIGSNDSTMLQYYDSRYKRIGVDPTGKQFSQYYADVELISDYFTFDNFRKVYKSEKPKIVSSISMFYDLPDPVQFAKDIYEILDDNGIWTCEQSYIITMINKNSIDTICHEHIEYYSITAIKHISDAANFKIIDIKFNDCNGGSCRIYFCKKNCDKYTEAKEIVLDIIEKEEKYGIKKIEMYQKFLSNCDAEIAKLNKFIDAVNQWGKKVYVYGASTKGNCLLQYANITEEKIPFAVERNLNKVGKMTSTRIQIISEKTMRENPPNYLLVLPWHFRQEIIEREDEYLENGGQLIFPLPHFEIYSKKPKVLVTGCEGMIAKYVIEEYMDNNNYNVYGFGHINKKQNYDMIKFYFDISNRLEMETNLSIIKPDLIVNLAGISSSIQSFSDPIRTLEVNGLAVAHICDIIFKNKWNTKLFHASSSDLYKGHITYHVNEDDPNMYNNHPYAIAKTMSHQIIDFYKDFYHLPFSNGVLFTIESKYRNSDFLLKKISNHAKKWKQNREPLHVGKLDSFRNILHGTDAAKAIKLILDQNKGENYLVCGTECVQIMDIVLQIYKKNGIDIQVIDNVFYCNNEVVAIIENKTNGIDVVPTKINGDSTKLHSLGWRQKYTIEDIISEYC